jgi:hypothetical protein
MTADATATNLLHPFMLLPRFHRPAAIHLAPTFRPSWWTDGVVQDNAGALVTMIEGDGGDGLLIGLAKEIVAHAHPNSGQVS